MTVMKETGVIVVSTQKGSLCQFSLQEGSFVKKKIKPPCEHGDPYLLCLQVAGQEYLALSCYECKHIKLMSLNKQLNSDSPIHYEMITAFKGEEVDRMCHGEKKRIFVQSAGGAILELNTSTTTFTEVRRIRTGRGYSLCYVPDPHRLIVVRDGNEVRAVSCDNNVMWRITGHPGRLLYLPSHDAILVYERDAVVVLNPETGSELKSIPLPDRVRTPQAVCLFNNQVMVASYVIFALKCISYFDLK